MADVDIPRVQCVCSAIWKIVYLYIHMSLSLCARFADDCVRSAGTSALYLPLFLFSVPRERQGIVFICIYIGVSRRTLSCTLTRRRFPIFRPETLDRKAPAFESIVLSHSLSPLPLFSFSPLAHGDSHVQPSSRHIRTKSNVSCLRKRLRLRRIRPFVCSNTTSRLSFPSDFSRLR